MRKELYKKHKKRDINSNEKEIIHIKTQLEEAKRREEIISNKLTKWERNCERLEAEVVSLRKDI